MALGTEGYAVAGCEEDVTCVIARIDGSVVAVGDTKQRDQSGNIETWMNFGVEDWQGLVDQEKADKTLAVAAAAGERVVRELSDGHTFVQEPTEGGVYWARSDQPGAIMGYTLNEVVVWSSAAQLNKFDSPQQLQPAVDGRALVAVG